MYRQVAVMAVVALFVAGGTTFAAEEELTPAEQFVHEKLGERCHTHELWPGDAPDEPGKVEAEKVDLPEDEDGFAGVQNVTEPSLTVCRPEDADGRTPAVMVCPGGGYHMLAIEHEGTEIAEWLNGLGITAVILKYRVPRREEGYEKHHHALQDAQRAMGLIRQNAAEWGINPEEVGMLGFSAGGHLTATLSNNYAERTYERVDEADGESCRPDFAIPIYPAYLRSSEEGLEVESLQHPDEMSPETTPPTFMAASQMDQYMPSSLAYLRALTDAGVPAELHIYPGGTHGTGMRAYPFRTWTTECERWLRDRTIIAGEE